MVAASRRLLELLGRSRAPFEAQQLAEFESLIRRFEARQDSNNVQFLQAVMEQTQQSTAESRDFTGYVSV